MGASLVGSFRAQWLMAAAGVSALAFAACGTGDPFTAGEGGSAGKAGEGSEPSGGKSGAATGGSSSGGKATGGKASGGNASEGGEPNEGGAPTSEGGAGGTTCPANFGDCNEKSEDGCETPLVTAKDCGSCANACSSDTAPHCGKSGGKYECTNPVANLGARRIELPCVADVLVPELCGSVSEAETAACKETGKLVMQELTIGGEAGAVYNVTLRIRGVVESKIYEGGKDLGDHFYQGGEPTKTNYNAFGLQVSQPPQNYFFNAATSTGETYQVFKLDHTKVIQAAGGATVMLAVSDPDCAMVRNCQTFSSMNDVECKPYVVDGIPPAPASFSGQFVQLDVVKVTRVADP